MTFWSTFEWFHHDDDESLQDVPIWIGKGGTERKSYQHSKTNNKECQKVTYTLKPSLVANEGKVRNLKKHWAWPRPP
jgi:hypothetical protein